MEGGVPKEKKLILWFEELRKEDVPLVGGKCANLGEMINAGIPVPPGFAVTAYAYKKFIEETGIRDKIYEIIREVVKEKKPEEYQEASRRIRELIESTPMPKDIEEAIRKSYRKLSKLVGKDEEFVAVRSSATAEDLPDASFAGQQETFLNVKGEDEVVKMVQKCWSSLFTPRAIFYREQKGFAHEKVLISVAVQKMVNAKSAGVMFTIHPVTGEQDKILIEANWGLGEAVVSGSVTPDEWIVDKNTLQILEKRVVEKTVEYIRDPKTGKTIHAEVPQERRNVPCLTDEEVKRLAELGVLIEKHYGKPQDIEWAIDRDLPFPQSVFIVQSRPETVWSVKKAEEVKVEEKPTVTVEKRVVVKGLPASPGIAWGKAKVAFSPEEAAKLMQKGDVLVTVMTNPDWVPYMRIASAIVTDEGGMTCIGPDTKVLTDRGLIKVKDLYEIVRRGEEVHVASLDTRTLKVIWRRVLKAMKRRSKAWKLRVYEHFRKREDYIWITPDHDMIVLNGRLGLSLMNLKDVVNSGKYLLSIDRVRAPYIKYDYYKPDLYYLFGALLSDGAIAVKNGKPYGIRFTQKVEGNSAKFVENVIKIFKENFEYELRDFSSHVPIKYKGYTWNRVSEFSCNGKEPALLMYKFKENLSRLMLVSNEEEILMFLAGYIDGDGYYNPEKGWIEIYTSSRPHLEGLVIACLRLGIRPRVGRRKGSWILIIPCSKQIEKILAHCTRINPSVLKSRVEGVKKLAARDLLEEIYKEIDWRGYLYKYVKDNLLIDLNKLYNYVRSEGLKSKVEKFKNSDLISIRFEVTDSKEMDVYNITVDANSEEDHNYVVFTSMYTPLVIGNCHAAIVSRELGIPCIVGTREATKAMRTGDVYTVDAKTGVVYEGLVEELAKPEVAPTAAPTAVFAPPIEVILKAIKPPTGTKVYMNLGVPEKIKDYKDLPFDGIGLLRIEFTIASHVVDHPLYLIETGRENIFIDRLADGIAMVAREVFPRPVVVRFSDFKTNEYRQLRGGEKYEPHEDNPMLGWRGVSRYISPQYEEAFRLECRAIVKVREEYGLTNVWVMAPFVRTLWESERFIEILKEEGLKSSRDFKIWAMAEVPSIAFCIEKFARYFDGFSMGTNDLTQLVLGTDRDSAILPKIDKRYFDERDLAVRRAVYMIIRGAHESPYGYKTVSICGQAPSVYPEFTAFLIRAGIDSVSVNPDVVVQTKYLVASVEQRLQLEEQYGYRPPWKSPVKRIWEIWPEWLEE